MFVLAPLSIAGCLLLFVNLNMESKLLFLTWTVLGLIFYFLYGYRHSHVARGLTEVPELAIGCAGVDRHRADARRPGSAGRSRLIEDKVTLPLRREGWTMVTKSGSDLSQEIPGKRPEVGFRASAIMLDDFGGADRAQPQRWLEAPGRALRRRESRRQRGRRQPVVSTSFAIGSAGTFARSPRRVASAPSSLHRHDQCLQPVARLHGRHRFFDDCRDAGRAAGSRPGWRTGCRSALRRERRSRRDGDRRQKVSDRVKATFASRRSAPLRRACSIA